MDEKTSYSSRFTLTKKVFPIAMSGVLLAFLPLILIIVHLQTQTKSHANSTTFKLFGVNVSGGEFGENALPGTMYTNYIYPNDTSRTSYFTGKGLTLIRFPVLWERVQHQAFGPLTPADITAIHTVLRNAAATNTKVILELHNYGQYYHAGLHTSDSAELADVWGKLATEFHNEPALFGYELMNEPHDLPDGNFSWQTIAQASVTSIRHVDQSVYILIPGNSWQSADNWPTQSDMLKNITDPGDSAKSKLIYSAHVYFDYDASGTHNTCVSDTIGVTRANNFLNWFAANQSSLQSAKAIFTEYGVPNDSTCLAALNNFLSLLRSNPYVIGGTYWASGPWWGNYMFSIEPSQGQTAPQMSILSQYPSTGSIPIATQPPISPGSATQTPTQTPPQSVNTPVPGDTIVGLTIALHGIGNSGDSANPAGKGNMSPLHSQRTAKIELYDLANKLAITKQALVTFDPLIGYFTAHVNLGNTIISGNYTIKVKTDQSLRALFPGIQSITAGTSKNLPTITLLTGDINNDNRINLLDYNLLTSCYSDLTKATNCAPGDDIRTDLNGDGHVDAADYNLFLRELNNRGGQ